MAGVYTPGVVQVVSARPNPAGAPDASLLLFYMPDPEQSVRDLDLEPGLELPAPLAATHPEPFQLRVLHFNDFHGRLLGVRANGSPSALSRYAWLIKKARREILDQPNQAVLVLNAGDDCGGSIFDEMLVGTGLSYPRHPCYGLFSRFGLDAACLGNHDLGRGLENLALMAETQADYPILASNLRLPPDLAGSFPAAALLTLKGLRVGLIGLVTRAESHLSEEGCLLIDPAAAVENLLPLIRPHCDLVILITHLGFSLDGRQVPMRDAGDVELARRLPAGAVDLIVGGHSHHVLNKTEFESRSQINGIPIVQAGSQGEYLGEVYLEIKEETSCLQSARLISTLDSPADLDFDCPELTHLGSWVESLLSQKLGVKSLIGENRAVDVRSQFVSGECALANFLTDALVDILPSQGYPVDLAMVDCSALQSSLGPGDELTFGDCFQLMPYNDKLWIYSLTGAQLLQLVRENALRLSLPPREWMMRGFLQFSAALRYQIQVGDLPHQNSILQPSINGQPLEDFQEGVFQVASTSFTREAASAWEDDFALTHGRDLVCLGDLPHRDTGLYLRDEMIALISDRGGITPQAGAVLDGRLVVHQTQNEEN